MIIAVTMMTVIACACPIHISSTIHVMTRFALWHRSAWPVRCVKGSAAPTSTIVSAPACSAREQGIVEAIKGGWARAVNEWRVAEKRDVVEAKVPN